MLRILLSLIPGLGIPAAFTFMYASTLDFAPLWVWLITINLMLIALMGKDKLTAQAGGRSGGKGSKSKRSPFMGRTPEFSLLTLTLLGATPGMFLARYLFNHKTSKQEFIYMLYGTIAVQAGLVYYFWDTLKIYA